MARRIGKQVDVYKAKWQSHWFALDFDATMDVIGEDEESDFGDFMDVGPEWNGGSEYVIEEVDASESSVSDSKEGEFTKQLRKQHK